MDFDTIRNKQTELERQNGQDILDDTLASIRLQEDQGAGGCSSWLEGPCPEGTPREWSVVEVYKLSLVNIELKDIVSLVENPLLRNNATPQELTGKRMGAKPSVSLAGKGSEKSDV